MSAAPSLSDLVQTADQARHNSDFILLNQTADALERLEHYDWAWKFLSEVGLSKKKHTIPEWNGEPLDSTQLIVERRIRHIGSDLRMARFLQIASQSGFEIVSSVDYRLMALFQRSFPEIYVINHDLSLATYVTRAKSCSYESLALHFGADKSSIKASFSPLKPNEKSTSAFRSIYSNANLPIIGIAWNSLNIRKELPGIQDWASFISDLDNPIVSLQYDEEKNGLQELIRLSGKSIVSSNQINQFLDLDGFAAQVAATDLVVTISNTTAHMAGALGIPCLVILDDLFQLSWPYASTETPFYPSTRLVRRNGRSWNTVFEEISTLLDSCSSPTDLISSVS